MFTPKRQTATVPQGRTRRRLFAIAVEKGPSRIPDVVYTHAESREAVLASLVSVTSMLPKRSRVVAVGEAWGYFHDEQGTDLSV